MRCAGIHSNTAVFPASIGNAFTITDALSGTAAGNVSILVSDFELSS